MGNVQISAQAMHLLMEHEKPVIHLSTGGWFHGISHGPGPGHAYSRHAQYLAAADTSRSADFARQLVRAKIPNPSPTLRPLAPQRHPSLAMSRRPLTSSRRVYLCSYDVADDKRRTRLFDLLKDHGEHVQFSLFLCELSPSEYTRLLTLCREHVHAEQDQLLLLDLGPPHLDWTQCLNVLGKPWTPAVRCHII